ncbi:MAG: hypothetical protein DRP63_01330 [Planctomycetota bacterium]|nr:MAG: hypothetical protein DRP63_01330 [Planctomycetota bacterium]
MRGTVAAIAVLIVVALLGQEDKDVIVLRRADGTTKRQEVDKVVEETYEKIKYKIGASWQEEAAENVVDVIRRVDASRDFLEAEEKREKSNFAAAKRRYERILKTKHPANDWEKAYAAFYRAYCTFMMGLSHRPLLKEALKQYEDFISANPRHRLTPRALRDKGVAQTMIGDVAGAKATFTRLARGDYGRYWTVVGKFWVGEIAYRQGATAEAKRLWNEVKVDSVQYGLDHIPAKYELVLAEEALKGNRIEIAIRHFEKVTKYNPQRMEHPIGDEVMAKAHNGLGDCYLSKGGNDKNMLLLALVEYIKARDLFAGGGVKEVKRALQGAIEACKRLEALESDEKKKQEFVSMRENLQAELAHLK